MTVAPRSETVLSVSGFSAWARSGGQWTPLVSDMSFSIDARKTLAVVGESGSGKSITALSIMRLLPPHTIRAEGKVCLGDIDLLTLSERQMRDIRGDRIGMIFQEPMSTLNPTLSIGSQVAEVLVRHRKLSKAEARAEVLRLLDRVRIPAARLRYDDFPNRLSGGMRQRVMIAMALACRPKLLIADEPTTALDVTVQAQILALIKEIQDEDGTAILFITHDMGVVAEVADETVVLRAGKRVEQQETRHVFSAPQSAYTRQLIEASGLLSEGKEAAAAYPPSQAPHVPGSEVLLDVRNLTTTFDLRKGLLRRPTGSIRAVENISFSIRRGETLALVGESGSGKSTTGRSIMRLVEPRDGEILLEGEDVATKPQRFLGKLRRNVQMVFQDPYASLDPRMTIGEAIMEPAIANGILSRRQAHARACDLLHQVGLDPNVFDRYPHEFSGGQRQRICIARALAMEPKLIVADEAVSALDATIKMQIIDLLQDLQRRMELSFLFITHDIGAVRKISHRVAVMYLGEIVEIGPTRDVLDNPRHPYTRKLLAAVPIPDPARRHYRPEISSEELPSPFKSAGYVPPQRRYDKIGPHHLVQVE